jgi:hypothetical protein
MSFVASTLVVVSNDVAAGSQDPSSAIDSGCHNLHVEDASQEVTELLRDGLAAFTVDQRSRHTDVNPDECAACRAEIKHSMNPLPVFDRRKR